jgi:chromosomal replication initiator protein
VVGAGNEFAHAACRAVAAAPAKRYNPLFLYGGSGLGKTHLMHAIGLEVLQNFEKKKVVFISSEEFTNEFIDAIQNARLVQFRKRFRQADVLLIDDIHFLAGKERSQEEFFHTFNSLFDGHKQIVMSSDKPPSEINGLEHRLVSRFEWGLTAQLLLPDVETRHAILRKKANRMKIPVDDRILNYLAEHIRTNVRRLEGALTRVASYSSLSAHSLSLEDVEGLLRDFLREEASNITIEQIQKKVCKHFDLRLSDMLSKKRPANIALPRQIAMYLCRQHTRNSLVEIGEAFGGRDHGTVLHACRTIERKAQEQDKIRQALSLLDSQLTGGC